MGAFDGYWIPRYGILPRGNDDSPPRKVTGFYVSWSGDYGGAIGQWSPTREKADALFNAMVAKGKRNVAKWYKSGESHD